MIRCVLMKRGHCVPRRVHQLSSHLQPFIRPSSIFLAQNINQAQNHLLHAFTRSASSTACMAAAAPTMVQIERVPALQDNYIWVLHDPSSNVTAVVDPATASPVDALLQQRGWKLSHILNTHHHWDHTGANLELKQRHNATIIGPRADAERIPGIDLQVGDGDTIPLGAITLRVYDTPGHTKGHISIYLPDVAIPDMPNATGALFCGDTLFAMGCGRLFEGTPAQMWASLSKLVVALPPTTAVYCAHEYTKSNARFALHVDGGNDALQRRAAAVDAARAAEQPTVPCMLEEELQTNPFLRPSAPGIRKHFGLDAGASDVEVFAALRKAKDTF